MSTTSLKVLTKNEWTILHSGAGRIITNLRTISGAAELVITPGRNPGPAPPGDSFGGIILDRISPFLTLLTNNPQDRIYGRAFTDSVTVATIALPNTGGGGGGTPGPPGPPGPAGNIEETYQAAVDISASQVVYINTGNRLLYPASNTILPSMNTIFGIATEDTNAGDTATIQTGGSYVSESWNWEADKMTVFVGSENGQLTQSVPERGYQMSMGFAIGANTLFIRPGIPILLSESDA